MSEGVWVSLGLGIDLDLWREMTHVAGTDHVPGTDVGVISEELE